MSSPIKPESDWFRQHLIHVTAKRPAYRGTTIAPADATFAPGPRAPLTAAEKRRLAKQALGGAAQGVAQIPADLAHMVRSIISTGPAIEGNAKTGTIRTTQAPTMGQTVAPVVDRAASAAEHGAELLGDALAGGAPETEGEQGIRGASRLLGNLAGYELGGRGVLAGVRALRGAGSDIAPALLKNLAREGGATLTPSGAPFGGSGFAVADPAMTGSFSSAEEARAFLGRQDVQAALANGAMIGKWTDPATGVTEINVSNIIPDRKAALKLAAQRGEQSIGHLEAGQYQGDIQNPHAPLPGAKALVAQMNGGKMLPRVTEVPAERGKQLANAYAALPAHDPAAKEAYAALNREIEQQYKAITDAGYKIEFTDADPYKNSAEMLRDLRENGRLKVFKTPGEGAHPFMSAEQNDRFRAVHDFIAHAGGGNQFGPVGEENAYRIHASTLSPEAQRALATETRGQNSFVNFGPNAHLPAAERPFAPQKAALFPEGLLGDYHAMPEEMPAYPVSGEAAAPIASDPRDIVNRQPIELPPAEAAVRANTERLMRSDRARQMAVSRGEELPFEQQTPFPSGGLLSDEAGRPIPVYRGEHGPSGLLETRGGSYSFAENPDIANLYATEPNVHGEVPAAPRVTRAHLEMRNPWINTPDDPFVDVSHIRQTLGDEAARSALLKYADDAQNTNHWEETFGNLTPEEVLKTQGLDALNDVPLLAHRLLDDPDFVSQLKAKGFDSATHAGSGESALDVEHKVFDPSQVRSPEAGIGGARILGGMTAGGASGALAGGQVGDTPDERLRNSLLGLGLGMVGGGALGMAGREGLLSLAGDDSGALRLGREAGRAGSPTITPAIRINGRAGGKTFKNHIVNGEHHLAAYQRAEETLGLPDSIGNTVEDSGGHTVRFGYASPEQRRSPGLVVEEGFRIGGPTGRFASREDALAWGRKQRGLIRDDLTTRERLRRNRGLQAENLAPRQIFSYGNERGAVGFRPTSRGVFDRSAPALQGTAEVDPRLMGSMPRGEASELAQAIGNSRVVERGLQKEVEEGLPLGGALWYEGGPIKALIDELGGPFNFHDFNLARGSGSIQNPTHNEVATATGLLFGRAHGLGSMEEIKNAHKAMYPSEPGIWGSEGTFSNYQRAVENGAQLPATAGAAERKVPWYTHGNEGGSLEGLPALDTHERRRLLSLAETDRRIKPLLKQLGLSGAVGRADGSHLPIVPIKNALDYEALGRPYQRIAKRMGLPSTQAAQAGRWLAGANRTGMLSSAAGDFTQTLEDALMHTARTRGLGETPAALRELFGRFIRGEDIATPVYGKDPFKTLYTGQGLLGL